MTKDLIRGCLFGGAIFAAGAAQADTEFAFSTADPNGNDPNWVFHYGYSYDLGSAFLEGGYRTTGSAAISNASYGFNFDSSITTTSISATLDGSLTSSFDGYVASYAFATVDIATDTEVLLDWYSTGDANAGAVAWIYRDTGAGAVEEYRSLTANGTTTYTLLAGETYWLWSFIRLDDNPYPSGWEGQAGVSFTIVPAPASAALLGLGGLVAARRRR